MPASRPASSRPGWLQPLVIVVIALAVSAGIAARGLYHQQGSTGGLVARPDGVRRDTGPPGSATVRMTADAAGHPEQAAVRELLQSHFDAINEKNYQAWTRTVTAERVSGKPRSVWASEYESTRTAARWCTASPTRNGAGSGCCSASSARRTRTTRHGILPGAASGGGSCSG